MSLFHADGHENKIGSLEGAKAYQIFWTLRHHDRLFDFQWVRHGQINQHLQRFSFNSKRPSPLSRRSGTNWE
jgi:hypothetical protein